jgi:hypothetical protein
MHTRNERKKLRNSGGERTMDPNSTCEFPPSQLPSEFDRWSQIRIASFIFIHSQMQSIYLHYMHAWRANASSTVSLSLSLDRPGKASMHVVYLVFFWFACSLGFFRIISTHALTDPSVRPLAPTYLAEMTISLSLSVLFSYSIPQFFYHNNLKNERVCINLHHRWL